MANKKSQADTNVQKVRQQNAQSANQQAGQFESEFASETDAQRVRQQNQQSQARKQQSTQKPQQ